MTSDPQQPRTFIAVVDHRSFSAQALGCAQSAVSQHIAHLEADLEAPLLTRRPRRPPRRALGIPRGR